MCRKHQMFLFETGYHDNINEQEKTYVLFKNKLLPMENEIVN